MGLAQRRIIAEYKEKNFPQWKSKIDAAAGFDVPMEVKWDTLANDDYEDKAMNFECFDKVFFAPLVEVMKNIGADDMGRTALRESLKKIVIDGTDGTGPHNTTFEGGQMTINHRAHTNIDNHDERVKGWTKLLEANL